MSAPPCCCWIVLATLVGCTQSQVLEIDLGSQTTDAPVASTDPTEIDLGAQATSAETDAPEDYPGVPTVDVVWGPDTLKIQIQEPWPGGFVLGMAETAFPADVAWLGEDCVSDDTVCHSLSRAGGVIDLTWDLQEVGDGTTLFHDMHAENLTFFLMALDASLSCWTWGHDPSYYTGLACTAPDLGR